MHSNNILLTKSGLAQLTDFGVYDELEKCCYGKLSDRSGVMYVAPEVHTGVTEPKSDVWSLGTCVIEMVEGRNPYEGCSYTECLKKKMEEEPPSLSAEHLSPELVSFVAKCLVKDVNQRASVSELLLVCAPRRL